MEDQIFSFFKKNPRVSEFIIKNVLSAVPSLKFDEAGEFPQIWDMKFVDYSHETCFAEYWKINGTTDYYLRLYLTNVRLKINGMGRKHYKVPILGTMSSTGSFTIDSYQMDLDIRFVFNNKMELIDGKLIVISVPEFHVYLSLKGLPGFVEGPVERMVESKKDTIFMEVSKRFEELLRSGVVKNEISKLREAFNF